ncbi:MAG TPA: SE1561 family protein [Massilibacterium sp.]|nr:SE1561 family protein [Massilibacterium sp.]
MGKATTDKEKQIQYLQERLVMIDTMLDGIDPDLAGLEEIETLISVVEDVEFKLRRFQKDWESSK